MQMSEQDRQKLQAMMMRMSQEKLSPPVTMESQVASQLQTLDPKNMPNSGMSDPYAAAPSPIGQDFSGAERGIQRQMDYANMLRGKAAPQGRTVGPSNIYVAPNWGESLAYGVDQGIGGYMAGRANKADADLDKKRTAQKTAIYDQERGDRAVDIGLKEKGLSQAMERFGIEGERSVDAAALIADFNRKKEETRISEREDTAAATIEAERLKAEAKALDAKLDRENKLAIAQAKKNGTKEYNSGGTEKERTSFREGGGKASATFSLMNGYKDEYSAIAPVRLLPGGATLAGAVERINPLTDADVDSAQWWSDAAKREMKPRHELFGSAFTQPEQEAYNATTFAKDDSPAFIRKQLEIRYKLEKIGAERLAAGYLQDGYDPVQVKRYYGDSIDVKQLQKDIESGEYDKRLDRQQAEARGEVESGSVLPPEKQSRLEVLRKKRDEGKI